MSETLIGLLHKSSNHCRPSQVAWAVVLGCFCGLLPKTSLLFPACFLVTFLLPIHFVTACVSMLVAGCCNPLLHPLLGNLGHWMFQGEFTRQWVNRLDSIPLVPWFKLHNTVVMGAISLWAVLAGPFFWLVRQALLRPYAIWLSVQHQRQLHSSIQLCSKSAPLIALSIESTQKTVNNPPLISPHVEPQPLSASFNKIEAAVSSLSSTCLNSRSTELADLSLAEAIDSIHALEDLLEKVNSEEGRQVDVNAVLNRATKASELVDEILQSLDSVVDTSITKLPRTSALAAPNNSISGQPRLNLRVDAPQTFLSHDTKISIYRRARTGETLVSGMEQNTPLEKDSMPTAVDQTEGQAELRSDQPPPASISTTHMNTTASSSTETVRIGIQTRHEEALRYLLSHLRALKEKV